MADTDLVGALFAYNNVGGTVLSELPTYQANLGNPSSYGLTGFPASFPVGCGISNGAFSCIFVPGADLAGESFVGADLQG
jgi:hypothetical protein